MKTKGSVIILLLIEVICLVSHFFHKPVDISELENRTMMTFDMVINNSPKEDSIVYKETTSERLEEALKDQFFGRDWITIHYANYTAGLETSDFDGNQITKRMIGLL